MRYAWIVLLLVACMPRLSVPDDAQLSCSRARDCPDGWVCRENVGKCVKANGSADLTPPELVGKTAVTPTLARVGSALTVSFDVNEALLTDPAVTAESRTTSWEWSKDEAASTGTHFVYTHLVVGNEPEGTVNLFVSLQDNAGNTAKGLSLGVFGVDFQPPGLVSGRPAAAAFKASDLVVYTINVSELLAAPTGRPVLIVKQNGAEQADFFAVPELETGTSFTWAKDASSIPDGEYAVEVVLTDEAGNTSGVLAGEGFTVDASLPVLSHLTVSPARARANDTVTVAFDASEPIAAARLVATLGGRKLDCSPGQPSSPNYSCSYAIAGDEIAAGTEENQAVLVSLTDSAGNRGEGFASVVLDFRPPRVAFATLAYEASANPLGVVQAAAIGTKLIVQVQADEALDLSDTPSMTAAFAASTLIFATTAHDASGATFEVTVPPSAVDGIYVPVIAWSDTAGNQSATTTFSSPKIVLKTSIPSLLVEQSEVTYLRSPWGNGASEVLGAFTIPPGAYYALAPADTLAPVLSLPANTFSFAAEAPALVRVWADATRETLLGTLHANPDGTWPRMKLANFDTPFAFASGVDVAGNESASVQIQNSEWVASTRPPALGLSPHRLGWTSSVDERLAPDPITLTTRSAESTDGQALLATAEAAWQELHVSASKPNGRAGHALAYDVARQRVVLFGGKNDAGYLQDVWEWDGKRWQDKTPSSLKPDSRVHHAMVYDSVRNRIVLFGGNDGTSLRQDLWEWDGVSWVEQTPASELPEPRWYHAMAYDTARGRVVLFGGATGTGVRQDVWEWDGTRWADKTPLGTKPDPRERHAMAYDSVRGRVVLFGGLGMGFLQDTWEWNGEEWEPMTSTDPPPSARYEPVMAFDTTRGVTVLFGGNAMAGGMQQDAWSWNGETWANDTPSGPKPEARVHAALAYDGVRGEVVLFSGQPPMGYAQDTWAWNGNVWSDVTPSVARPSARTDHAVAYDSFRKRLVLFGGWNGSAFTQDTWEWDGARWRDLTPTGLKPNPRAGHAMTYDSTHHRVVLFGGYPSTQDLWEWNGEEWEDKTPAGTKPMARSAHAIAYDAFNDRIVVFGGHDGIATTLGDTWVWNGSLWEDKTPVNPDPSPSPRTSFAMAYDAFRHRVVLFGGYTPLNSQETWEWDGGGWQDKTLIVGNPPGRQSHAMAYDSDSQRVLVFGGETNLGYANDAWAWDGDTWLNTTPPGLKPSPRHRQQAAYDTNEHQFLVQSGEDAVGYQPDLWAWNLDPARRPAVHFQPSLAGTGITAPGVTGLRIRAHCGGDYSPFSPSDIGAGLYAWRTSVAQPQRPGWFEVGGNTTGINPTQPYLPTPNQALTEWAATTSAQARAFVLERDAQLAFQCRPHGFSDQTDEASVALDYVEARIRYTSP